MKKKIKFLLIAVALFFAIVFATGLLFFRDYSSKVILAGPFSINVYGLSEYQFEHIKIYGYSPYGKYQELSRGKEENKWEYPNYSSFKNLYVYLQDSNYSNVKIVIISRNKQLQIRPSFYKNSGSVIELTPFIYGLSSNADLFYNFLHWDEFVLFALFTIIIIYFIIAIFLFKYRNGNLRKKLVLWSTLLLCVVFFIILYNVSGLYLYDSGLIMIILLLILVYPFINLLHYIFIKKRKPNAAYSPGKKLIILLSLFFFIIIFHIAAYIYSSIYLRSSGLLLYVLLAFVTFWIFVFIGKFSWKIKSRIKEIRLTIITITLCLCLFEIILILKNTIFSEENPFYFKSPYIPQEKNWFHIWDSDHNLKTRAFCHFRKINSEGLSDKEHPVEKKRNEYRIMGLGDSFTEGDGADADSTWLKFLERSMQKDTINKQLTFINAGVCGSDPFFEYILLRDKLLKYKPDIVIVAINNSDIGDISIRGGFERFISDGSLQYKNPPWWEPIYAMVHLSRLVYSNILGYNELLVKTDSAYLKSTKEKILQVILSFDELAKTNDFKFLLVFNPSEAEIVQNHSIYSDIINRINKNTQIESLNLVDYFVQKEQLNNNNSNSIFWKNDGHHNAKGYEMFARGVHWKLKEMGIIDSLKKD